MLKNKNKEIKSSYEFISEFTSTALRLKNKPDLKTMSMPTVSRQPASPLFLSPPALTDTMHESRSFFSRRPSTLLEQEGPGEGPPHAMPGSTAEGGPACRPLIPNPPPALARFGHTAPHCPILSLSLSLSPFSQGSFRPKKKQLQLPRIAKLHSKPKPVLE